MASDLACFAESNKTPSLRAYFYQYCFSAIILVLQIMLLRKICSSKSMGLLLKCVSPLISHKFYSGQGGELHLYLTKREYAITVETIWEDYSLLDIEGLSGVRNFTLFEEGGVSFFEDKELEAKAGELIRATLKIPEDYTLRGLVNGSVQHVATPVGKKLRSKPFAFQITGENHSLTLGDIKTENLSLTNKSGTISIPSLTVQQGNIVCRHFDSKKAMTSNSLSISSSSVSLRSIIMFGKSIGRIHSEDVDIESISGASQIVSEGSVKIERYYGGEGSINIKCRRIKDKLGIETGTGKIHFQTAQQASAQLPKISLGKMHKGSIALHHNIVTIC